MLLRSTRPHWPLAMAVRTPKRRRRMGLRSRSPCLCVRTGHLPATTTRTSIRQGRRRRILTNQRTRRNSDPRRAQDDDEEQTKTAVILTRKVDSGGAMTTRRTRKASPKIDPIDELQRLLGHRFTRPELLALALTHRSHTYEARHGVPAVILPAHPDQRDQRNPPGTDNEQLEFLGDSILGLGVTEGLYREFPKSSEGELTRLRSILVSRARMSEVGAQLGLGEQLLLGKSAD